MQLLKDTWESFGAEVIFITSNMQGNDEMMQGCREGTCIVTSVPSEIANLSAQLDYMHSELCGTSDNPEFRMILFELEDSNSYTRLLE